MRGDSATALAAAAQVRFVRILLVHALCSGRTVWFPPAFARLNDRFGETDAPPKSTCCAREQMLRQRHAQTPMSGKSREADLGPARSECLLSAHIYVYTLLCF